MAGCPKMSVTSPCMSLHAMLRRITWSRHNAGIWSGRRVTFRKDDADDVATLVRGGVMNPMRQAISIPSAGQLCQTIPSDCNFRAGSRKPSWNRAFLTLCCMRIPGRPRMWSPVPFLSRCVFAPRGSAAQRMAEQQAREMQRPTTWRISSSF